MFENILEKYSNVIKLKEGGQKTVYSVDHPVHGKTILKVGNCSSKANLERIKREVMVLRSIDSTFYPKNFDFKMTNNDTFVILEEYIESVPLSECLGNYYKPKDAINLIFNMAVGLNILWNKRIVHRDVKPDNILITPSGEIKIIDLGIAKLLDMESLTRTMAFRGPCTPIYASPEQLKNCKTVIDHRTDQFSLGIILLQILNKGVHPFDPSLVNGDSIVQNILEGNWYHPVVSGKLECLLSVSKRLLGSEPHQRYRKVETLFSDLKLCLEVL